MWKHLSLMGMLVAAANITGCGDGAKPPGGAGTSTQPVVQMARLDLPKKDKYIIGFSQCTVEEPWRVQMNADVKAAADQHANLELRTAVADDKIDKQVNDVENFIAQGVDFIIISPKETAQSLTDAVAKAHQKGIPVIVLDRRVLGDQYMVFIGADNQKIGRVAGEHARKLLDGKGKIVELKGNMSSTPGQQRHKGFRSAIEKELSSGAIRVVHEADIDWKEDRARSEMESALAANPQIDLVYGHNDPAAHGAFIAARQANRAGQIKFIGIDSLSHEGLAYVREGALDATVQYPTGGEEAVEVVLDLIAGKEVPRNVVLGTRLFTKENLEAGGEAVE